MALLAVGFALQPALATVLLCLVMALSGVLGWGFWAAQSSQLSAMAAKSVSLAISLNLTALNIGVAVTALVGGALVDRGGALYLPLLAAAMAVLATLAAFALPHPTGVGGTARISI
jgi:predicted MFS family arabinose efflux permease